VVGDSVCHAILDCRLTGSSFLMGYFDPPFFHSVSHRERHEAPLAHFICGERGYLAGAGLHLRS
jgi:hypothetical protein